MACEYFANNSRLEIPSISVQMNISMFNKKINYLCPTSENSTCADFSMMSTGIKTNSPISSPHSTSHCQSHSPQKPQRGRQSVILVSSTHLLHHDKPLMYEWHSNKTMIKGVIEVRDGHYTTDDYEDLPALQNSKLRVASDSPYEITKTNQSPPLLQSEMNTEIFHEKMNNQLLTLPAPHFKDWKILVLRGLDIRTNFFQAFKLGAVNMVKLVENRIFDLAEPLDNLPDIIWLDIDGENESYEIIQSSDIINCYRICIPSNCKTFHSENTGYKFTIKDFQPHKLVRENFYAAMAEDLDLTMQVCQLGIGLWELGRKNIAGLGRARFIFVEQGVEKNDIIACIALHGFKNNCLLFHGNPPAQINVPEKHVVSAQVFVTGGQFVTEIFEDLHASSQSSSATYIDLNSTPKKLVICGEEFRLPDDRGRPTLGVLYLAQLFENPRDAISCWDIERIVKPKLKDTTSIAFGADPRMDKKTQRALKESIKDARSDLINAQNDHTATPLEIDEAQSKLDGLLEQQQADTGKGGKSRLLGNSDKEKARRRVRKALDAVVMFIAKQNPAIREPLQEAIGEGAQIYFSPPPDWEL